jgi:hypothetical protein
MRPGCVAGLPAVLIVPALLASYFALMMTVLTILVILEVIRSV